MDQPPIPSSPPEQSGIPTPPPVPEQPPTKNKVFLWFSSTTQLIGAIIAVVLVIAGSFIVFGYNNKGSKGLSATNANKQKLSQDKIRKDFSQNSDKIKKSLRRANRALKASKRFNGKKDSPSVSTSATSANVAAITSLRSNAQLLTNTRITQLWQAQNAVQSNQDLAQSIRNQVNQRISERMNELSQLGKQIPALKNPTDFTNYNQQLQQQKIYSCFLPNLTQQVATEDLSQTIKNQRGFSKTIQGYQDALSSQGVKTDKLQKALKQRDQVIGKLETSVSGLRQNTLSAQTTNCQTQSPVTMQPIQQQFGDLSNLDQQIRDMVQKMLQDKGIGNGPIAISAVPSGTEKKHIRPTRAPKPTRTPKDKSPTPGEDTLTPDPNSEMPTPGDETPTPSDTTPEPTDSTTPAPEASPTPGEKPDFAAFNLPDPQIDEANNLKQSITDSDQATWAVQHLLAAERTADAKGLDVKRYLTTAWIWFETGGVQADSVWPDPYEINCGDNPANSEVSIICQSSSFQVAGYQAQARRNNFVTMFHKFYTDDQVADVIKQVASDSINAIRPQWNYNDQSQQKGVLKQYLPQLGNATIKDITPNSDFFSEKGQFMSLLAGKDPNMVITLNTYAVSDDDLIGQLKSNGYGYIDSSDKQLISNMVAALYLFDGGSL